MTVERNARVSRVGRVDDENNEAHIGDLVKITQTRPLSKDKCWRLVEILERAK